MSPTGIPQMQLRTAVAAVLLLVGTMLLATGTRTDELWAETAITVGAVLLALAYIAEAYP